MRFQPGRSARCAHDQLVAAVADMEQARHNAVLWFAEIDRRQLYRELGYTSMQQYAAEALRFSRTRLHDFLRLARRLDELPAIRASVASGELGYTKAREIVKVASTKTERQWLAAATSLSRRDLERKVARVRKKARQRPPAGQGELLPAPQEAKLAEAAPVRVGLTLTAEQAARYEALWHQLAATPNAEDLLEALAALVAERATPGRERGTDDEPSASQESRCTESSPRGNAASAHRPPPVQIHVHRCPDCGAMETAGRPVDRIDRERLSCDAAVVAPGRRNTTTIPPRTRREVLARDRHRCQAPGCGHTRFLELHHLTPRSRGGGNDADNLVTLCAACHRLWHERGWAPQTERRGAARAPE